MAIRHYVLLATDGITDLPLDAIPCSTARREVYVFGFVGGLYMIDDTEITPELNWKKSQNFSFLWEKRGTATIPAPMIWAEVGDHLYITLINLGMKHRTDLMDFHTVHMHGAHVPTQMDGFPESSVGVPMWKMDPPFEEPPTTIPPVLTYFFQPENPGTLMYHCHIEAAEHVQMGMYGAMVIYPSKESLAMKGITQHQDGTWWANCCPQPHIPQTATNRSFAYNDINSYFDKEYVMLLSDIDTTWHDSIYDPALGMPNPALADFNPVDFKPDWWLINGRAFPDTILPFPPPSIGSNSNLTQITYDSYVHVKTGQKFLLRMINMGYQVIPWHIHGWHFMVLGKDAHPSPGLLFCKDYGHMALQHGFTLTIGSGETYDLLLHAEDKRPLYQNYLLNGQDEIPDFCTQVAELQKIDPNCVFDIPTEPINCNSQKTINVAQICAGAPGTVDQFFPQFYPMHTHDDYKVTNNGVYPGGQLTLIQTDAP